MINLKITLHDGRTYDGQKFMRCPEDFEAVTWEEDGVNYIVYVPQEKIKDKKHSFLEKPEHCERCGEEKPLLPYDVAPQNFVITNQERVHPKDLDLEKITSPEIRESVVGRIGTLTEGYSIGPSKTRLWLCEDCVQLERHKNEKS